MPPLRGRGILKSYYFKRLYLDRLLILIFIINENSPLDLVFIDELLGKLGYMDISVVFVEFVQLILSQWLQPWPNEFLEIFYELIEYYYMSVADILFQFDSSYFHAIYPADGKFLLFQVIIPLYLGKIIHFRINP